MKKKIAILLSALLAMTALAACGEKEADTPATPGEPGAETPADEPSADAELELIVAHNQTSLENPYAYGIIKFKEVMEDISGGKVSVVLHHGTLGESESELIEKLEIGAADLVVASPGFMTSIGVPEVDMFSLLYLFNGFDHWGEALDGEFGNSMKQVVKEKTGNNFQIMDYWSAGVRDFYGKKSIMKPEDAKGMTIRTQTSGVVKDFWEQVGAVPTSVAWGELYQALQQGVVDSAENDYTNFSLKEHHKTPNGKFISETHHDYTTRLFLMNGNSYDKLTDEQKGWVDEASKAATKEERDVTYKMLDESKEKVIADGATVVNHEDMDIEAFKAIALPIQDKFATDNKLTEYLEMVRAIAE